MKGARQGRWGAESRAGDRASWGAGLTGAAVAPWAPPPPPPPSTHSLSEKSNPRARGTGLQAPSGAASATANAVEGDTGIGPRPAASPSNQALQLIQQQHHRLSNGPQQKQKANTEIKATSLARASTNSSRKPSCDHASWGLSQPPAPPQAEKLPPGHRAEVSVSGLAGKGSVGRQTYVPTASWRERAWVPFSGVWVELSARRLLAVGESHAVILAQPISDKLRWVGKRAPLPHASPAFPEPFPTPTASREQFSRHSCGKTDQGTH